MKILIADPNPLMRDAISKAVQPTGWGVESVEDGSSAFTYLNESKSPVLAFLSDELTAPSAQDLSKRFLNRTADNIIVPFIVTLSGDPKVVVDGLNSGASDVLVFPMNKEVIRAKADAAHRFVRRLDGAAASGGAQPEAVLEPTPPNVRATATVLHDKFRKIQTLTNSGPTLVEAIGGLGLDSIQEVEKHVFADKEPTFAMWCAIVAPQASLWVDVLVESDRKSAMLLFQTLTGMPAESGRDALDTLGEVVNIVQGAIKAGLQGEGHEVITAVVPKAVATANLPKLNAFMVDRVRICLNAAGILLSVSLYVCSRNVNRKTVETLQINDVTVEALPIAPGGSLNLLNRGTMIEERNLTMLRQKLTGEGRLRPLSVMECPTIMDLFRGA